MTSSSLPHNQASPIINAMTVDVEDYFQVSAFENYVARSAWEVTPLRVEANTDRILGIFAEHDVKATFFTLGWVAERCPGMVKRIVAEGHELASHGWEHIRVVNQSREEFREDAGRTKAFLEDLGGCTVNGYRAASYSIGARNLWALDVLADLGYKYSSSIAPIKHDLYGMPNAPRFRFKASGGRIYEVPITTLPIMGKNVNCGGGGWFRLFPYRLFCSALTSVNKREGESGLFYFHPWEIDPDQPRIVGASRRAKFRHYLNLGAMERRIERLLADFEWGRMDAVFFSAAERATWDCSKQAA